MVLGDGIVHYVSLVSFPQSGFHTGLLRGMLGLWVESGNIYSCNPLFSIKMRGKVCKIRSKAKALVHLEPSGILQNFVVLIDVFKGGIDNVVIGLLHAKT